MLQPALGKGKGNSLAFFLLFIFFSAAKAPFCSAQGNYPVIDRLFPTDTAFRQFTSDVQANRRRLVGVQARPQDAAEHLTIYQYTVKQEDDLFFLAARSNIPYAAIASLNRINNPTSVEAGKIVLLPSCPGLFIPIDFETDLEKLLSATRHSTENSVELRVSVSGKPQNFLFIPGADFTPTERAFFLNSSFRFPLRSFRISSPFGLREDPFSGMMSMHRGIDLAAPEGTEVFATMDGVVTAVGQDPVYGIYIIITHSNNWTSLYGHLQRVETVLRSQVKSGTLIGRVGTTGQSTGPHLHFELRQDGRPFDPAGRLRY